MEEKDQRGKGERGTKRERHTKRERQGKRKKEAKLGMAQDGRR